MSIMAGNVHIHMAVFEEIWHDMLICVQDYQKTLWKSA